MIKNILFLAILSFTSITHAEQLSSFNSKNVAFPEVLFVSNEKAITVLAAKPSYPMKAAQDHICGSVIVGVLIGLDGKVADTKVIHSSNSEILDGAAVFTAKKNIYKKLFIEQEGIKYQTEVAYNFSYPNPSECK